ncbi:hypothetical protein ONE63_001071 [Megalurothrips usitatus]|uniref:Secreted protein n=1 Tax=Megalurothrips usitatus TaxID=439358 RepID=A0AAV7XHS4_9NEOP|nr:hypothetical protein ONE63_001071 [Megalurothrips usitatus]
MVPRMLLIFALFAAVCMLAKVASGNPVRKFYWPFTKKASAKVHPIQAPAQPAYQAHPGWAGPLVQQQPNGGGK